MVYNNITVQASIVLFVYTDDRHKHACESLHEVIKENQLKI